MKKVLLLLLVAAFGSSSLMAQVIYDFEDAATSTNFQYFGSSLEAQLTSVIDNPNSSGINTSSKVVEYVKPAGAQVWAGAFSNPSPAAPIDATNGGQLCINVHMDHIGNLAVKLEGGTNGDANWITTQVNTVMNEWEQICFDLSDNSLEDNMEPGSGDMYTNIVLFFDFGADGGADDVTSYFDDVVFMPPSNCATVFDFEAGGSTTQFQYFGSVVQEAQLTPVVLNPDQSGINTTDSVIQYVKPDDAQTWAGAFANPGPSNPMDFTSGGEICIDVYMDHIGNLAMKLEGGTVGDPNWITTVANTKTNEWEQLCFDLNANSLEDNMEVGAGDIYTQVVLFFDFGVDGTTSAATSYFDNIVTCTSPVVEMIDVKFQVDMTGWSNVQGVNVRGEFNNWSEDNPMTDMGNGLWEATISMTPGAYQYKFWISNGDIWEEFTGLETCVSPPGQFVNRTMVVTPSSTLEKVCFNSCYACGDEVMISYELGMGSVTPSPDGVWLAGGGNFEAPGGRYKMDDSDGDGIYTISFPRQKGFTSFYTFANGNCPDYSCKEDISGQSCADPNNYNDRFLDTDVSATVSTCFGECTTNTMCTVGTNDLDVDNSLFSIAPNPATDFTVLQFNNRSGEDMQLSLFNTLGQQMMNLELNASTSSYELDMQQFTNGIYLLHLQIGNTVANHKIVKR